MKLYRFIFNIIIKYILPFSTALFLLYGGLNADDNNSHYTSVGNIGLTITNFGTIGHGFTKWPDQPSCEYPKESGIEHLFDGGLWVGGRKSGVIHVTTGAIDASAANRGEGFEFTNEAGQNITERSSLLTSPSFDPAALSHQDLMCEYTDTNTSVGGQIIYNHSPLGIKVIQQSYCWNYPYADFFVIIRYRIINIGYRGNNSPIDSIYTGMWNDLVVRNTNITRPGGSAFYTKGGNGYDSAYSMGYEFDSNGDPGFTNSYIGIKFLGSTPYGVNNIDTSKIPVSFVTWQFRNTVDPVYFAPQSDIARYIKLQGFFTENTKYNSSIAQQIKQPSNRSVLVSQGPYRTLNHLDTLEIVYGIVCAKKTGNQPMSWDSVFQRQELWSHSEWSQKAYNGEDKNGNGRLDPGEDINGNGRLDRYLLPAPPNSPRTRINIENKMITLFWSNNAEASIDPISLQRDFEGYRIYRTNAGADLDPSKPLLANFVLAGDYDSINSFGNNTGFNAIRLNQPARFDGDTTNYWYKMEFSNLLNGWQYAFTVTAYDRGDSLNDLESLESSQLENLQRVFPGTAATEDESVEIGVYPNPYYGNAYWDGTKERERKLYFFNLPAKCEITIYTISGDVVDKFSHDAKTYTGSDIQWFNSYSDGKQKLAGGEHAWDMISTNDQAVATGLYLFTVKNLNTGYIKKGKFLVIK